MPKKKRELSPQEETNELLKDLLIAQLGLAGVPQQQIRKIVGGDINRVNKIVRHLKTVKGKTAT